MHPGDCVMDTPPPPPRVPTARGHGVASHAAARSPAQGAACGPQPWPISPPTRACDDETARAVSDGAAWPRSNAALRAEEPPPAPHRGFAAPVFGRWLAGLAAVAVCLLVFLAYRHPRFLQTLADQLWACF